MHQVISSSSHPAGTPRLDRQMFILMWGPTVAAVSVVLDHAEEPAVLRRALDGFLLTAKIAAFHRIDDVRLLHLFALQQIFDLCAHVLLCI